MKTLILLCLTAFLYCNTTSSFAQNALHFDGTDDIVQTTFPGVLGSTNRTFEAWVFVDPSAPSSNLCIMDYGLNAVGSRNTFNVNGSRGLAYISGGTNANISSPAGTIPVGQWVHVAFVLNNGTGFLYVDGVQVVTGSLTTVNTPPGNQDLIIGQRVTGGSIRFEGSIDEVRVWNVARTQQEIQSDTIREFCLVPPGLVAYYKFNQGVAGGSNSGLDTLIDDAASNNGSLTGFALTGATSNWVTGKSLNTNTTSIMNDTSCGPYTSPSGKIWTTTGIYMDTIPNGGGCDSLMTINLIIQSHSTGVFNGSACDSLQSPSGNYWYTATGSYLDTIPSANGCDSVITVNVTIPVINDSISVNGNVLTAVQTGATYNWFDCSSGFVTIAGAVGQSYTITSSGNYAVSVQMSGCLDTSDCDLYFFTPPVGLKDNGLGDLGIYPNPTNGEIFIDGTFEGTLSIIDSKGVLVHEIGLMSNSNGSISLPASVQSGMYFLLFENDKVNLRKKILVIRE